MIATIVVAALGMASTLLATALTAHLHRTGTRYGRRFDARLEAYAELIGVLYEFERATYDRVKARIDGKPDDENREEKRQEAWRLDSRARSAISLVTLLGNDPTLPLRFHAVRKSIGDMNRAGPRTLREEHEQIYQALGLLVADAKGELSR